MVTGTRPGLRQRGDSFLLKSCLLAAPRHRSTLTISDTASLAIHLFGKDATLWMKNLTHKYLSIDGALIIIGSEIVGAGCTAKPC